MKHTFTHTIFRLSLTVSALLLIVVFLPIYSCAADGMCGNAVSYSIDENGQLLLTGYGETYDYEAVDHPFGDASDTIQSVVIADGITKLGRNLFIDLPLTDITIPPSVTQIGVHAIGYTYVDEKYDRITGLTIHGAPNSGAQAYAGANSISFSPIDTPKPIGGNFGDGMSWSLSDAGVLTINGNGVIPDFLSANDVPWHDYARGKDGRSIRSVELSGQITAIGNYAFSDCGELSAVTLPSSVTSIGQYSFAHCHTLSSFVFQNSLQSIGDYCCLDCPALNAVSFPSPTVSIGSMAFGYMSETGTRTNPPIRLSADTPSTAAYYANQYGFTLVCLNELDTVAGNTSNGIGWSFTNHSGLLSLSGSGAVPDYESAEKTPWAFIADRIQQVRVANGITGIGSHAFEGCANLTSCALGNVKSVGDFAFAETAIETISFPSSVKTLGISCFENCQLLKHIDLQNELEVINDYCFRGTPGLTEVTVPGNTVIGYNALGFGSYDTLSNNFILHGKADSNAELYASHNHITFREIGSTLLYGEHGTLLLSEENAGGFSFQTKREIGSPVFVSDTDFACTYTLRLLNNGIETDHHGTYDISLSLPDQEMNTWGLNLYRESEPGKYTPVRIDFIGSSFSFSNDGIGTYILTSANLDQLYTITLNSVYEKDGAEAAPQMTFFATGNANYNIIPTHIPGFNPTEQTIVGEINHENVTITAYYREAELIPEESTDDDDDQTKGTSVKKIFLIILIILSVILLLSVGVFLFLYFKKKKETTPTPANHLNKKIFFSPNQDSFDNSIDVLDAPTRELDIQSLFADEPESDRSADQQSPKQ